MNKAFLFLGLLPLAAQALTLQEALESSRQKGYGVAISEARSEEARANRLKAMQGLLPTLRAEAGWMNTTDPLNAFGTSLRQRSVTMESFDPARLNDPSSTQGYNVGLVAEVPLVNLDAWAGNAAAIKAAEAARSRAEAQEAWSALETVRAYADAVLAFQAIGAWEDALVAAKAHGEAARSGHREGIALRSDLLLAQVRMGEIEASLAKARSDSSLSLRQLSFVMGGTLVDARELDALPDASALRALEGLETPEGEPLAVKAAHLEGEAARFGEKSSQGALLPRVNGIARLDWNGEDSPFGNEGSWTLGVFASWTLASRDVGENKAAEARLRQARTALAMARDQSSLEEASLKSSLALALRRMDLAQSSWEQATEASRLSGRRYEEGLGTMSEVLQASAMETSARITFLQARRDALVSASGLMLSRSPSFERISSLTQRPN